MPVDATVNTILRDDGGGSAVDNEAGIDISASRDGYLHACSSRWTKTVLLYLRIGSAQATLKETITTPAGSVAGDAFGISVALSPSGKTLAVSGRLSAAGHEIVVYRKADPVSASTWAESAVTFVVAARGQSLCFSADGRILYYGAPTLGGVGILYVGTEAAGAINSADTGGNGFLTGAGVRYGESVCTPYDMSTEVFFVGCPNRSVTDFTVAAPADLMQRGRIETIRFSPNLGWRRDSFAELPETLNSLPVRYEYAGERFGCSVACTDNGTRVVAAWNVTVPRTTQWIGAYGWILYGVTYGSATQINSGTLTPMRISLSEWSTSLGRPAAKYLCSQNGRSLAIDRRGEKVYLGVPNSDTFNTNGAGGYVDLGGVTLCYDTKLRDPSPLLLLADPPITISIGTGNLLEPTAYDNFGEVVVLAHDDNGAFLSVGLRTKFLMLTAWLPDSHSVSTVGDFTVGNPLFLLKHVVGFNGLIDHEIFDTGWSVTATFGIPPSFPYPGVYYTGAGIVELAYVAPFAGWYVVNIFSTRVSIIGLIFYESSGALLINPPTTEFTVDKTTLHFYEPLTIGIDNMPIGATFTTTVVDAATGVAYPHWPPAGLTWANGGSADERTVTLAGSLFAKTLPRPFVLRIEGTLTLNSVKYPIASAAFIVAADAELAIASPDVIVGASAELSIPEINGQKITHYGAVTLTIVRVSDGTTYFEETLPSAPGATGALAWPVRMIDSVAPVGALPKNFVARGYITVDADRVAISEVSFAVREPAWSMTLPTGVLVIETNSLILASNDVSAPITEIVQVSSSRPSPTAKTWFNILSESEVEMDFSVVGTYQVECSVKILDVVHKKTASLVVSAHPPIALSTIAFEPGSNAVDLIPVSGTINVLKGQVVQFSAAAISDYAASRAGIASIPFSKKWVVGTGNVFTDTSAADGEDFVLVRANTPAFNVGCTGILVSTRDPTFTAPAQFLAARIVTASAVTLTAAPLGAHSIVTTGILTTFTETQASAAGADPGSFEWYFNGSLINTGGSAWTDTYTYADVGPAEMRVRVKLLEYPNGRAIPTEHGADTQSFSFASVNFTISLPVASFTFAGPAVAGTPMGFSDTSGEQGNIDSRTWEWAAGSTFTGSNGATLAPEHIFTEPGTYSVKLTVSYLSTAGIYSASGVYEATAVREVVISPAPTFSAKLPPVPWGAVKLTPVVERVPLTTAWNYGDGVTTAAVPGAPAALHAFSAAGVYTVTMSCEYPSYTGPNVVLETVQAVTLPSTSALDIDARYLPDGSLRQWDIARFTAHVPSRPTETTFDFGDGTPPVTGVLATPHAYAAPGRYTAVFTAVYRTAAGAFTDTLVVDVAVSEAESVEPAPLSSATKTLNERTTPLERRVSGTLIFTVTLVIVLAALLAAYAWGAPALTAVRAW